MRQIWMRVILHADQRLKQNHKEENLPVLHHEQFILGRELGPMLNQGTIRSPIMAYRRKLIHLLRHSQQVYREEDGAIEIWRIKDDFQEHFLYCYRWSYDKWKRTMARGGGNKKRYQWCTDSSGAILYFGALQGHSRRNLIDPTLQDNVVVPSNFFQYIYHVVCAITLHSIINSELTLARQNLSNRQTVFLPVDPVYKNHKDPVAIDLNAPRHAQHMHKAWKKHQNAVYRVDINLVLKKGLKFYQTRSNAVILYETLPAYCIPKVVRMETEEVIYEKVYASPRPPPKISLEHDCMKELGSEVAQRPYGPLVQQSKSSQSNQPNPKPNHDRTGTRCLPWRKSRARCHTNTFIWWQQEVQRWRQNRSW